MGLIHEQYDEVLKENLGLRTKLEQLQAELGVSKKRVEKLSELGGLLNSMILSGEDHSKTSLLLVEQVLKKGGG